MRKLIFAILLLASPVFGTTRYINDTGSDANSCAASVASGSAKLTFASAIACMAAGDTLIVMDGTYTKATHGHISISGVNGSGGLPYTIQAENERLAFISGDGTTAPLKITNSSYWVFHGLRLKNVDNCVGGSNYTQCTNNDNGVALVENCNNITLRRLLVSHNNRYRNQHLVLVFGSSSILVEEVEGYFAHRGGIMLSQTNNSTVRRCYINSRSYADIANGYPTSGIDSSQGDENIAVYPGSNNTIENSISETAAYGFLLQAAGALSGNHILGSIANSHQNGFLATTLDTSANVDTVIKNCVGISSSTANFWSRSNSNARFDNVTSFSGTTYGIRADRKTGASFGQPPYSFFSDNALAISNGTGVSVATTDGPTTWLVDYPNAFSNTTNYSPSSHANLTNNTTTDPSLGSCKLWIPVGNAMKGAGKAGADKGANILYQYVNRVLTSTPLWITSGGNTNNFTGCGVEVSGLNDSGNRCTTIDERLNVGAANGCAFPSGYGDAGSAGGDWLSTDNFDSYTVGNDLNGGAGGSGWTGNWTQGTAAVTIQPAPAGGQGGNAAFVNADPNFTYSRTFADLSAGIFSFRFWMSTNTPADAIFFIVDEGTGGTAARGMVSVDVDGFVKIWDGTGRFNLGPYTASTWHTVTGEFDDAAQPNKFRAKLNDGGFSSWYPVANGGAYAVINRFRVEPNGTTTFNAQLYWDDIKEGSTAAVVSTIDLVDAGIAGATMFPGEVKALQWVSTDLTGNIRLRISRDGGTTYQVLENAVPNTGSYNWTVMGPATTSAIVEVCGASNTSVCDTSLAFGIGGTRLTIR